MIWVPFIVLLPGAQQTSYLLHSKLSGGGSVISLHVETQGEEMSGLQMLELFELLTTLLQSAAL